jgi:SPP1 gp7 family putative phage head morphogenesis protein
MPRSLSQNLTAHQIGLQRLGSSEVKKSLPVIRGLARDISRLIRADLTPDALAMVGAIERDLTRIVNEATGKLATQLDDLTRQLSAYEGEFTRRLLSGYATVQFSGVSEEMLYASVTNKPMRLVSGKKITHLTITQAVNKFGDTINADVLSTIRTGMVAGRTTPQIAREVSGMIGSRTRAQATALVRTTTNHIGSQARETFYQANEDILEGERVVATLDGKTTIECMSLDGNVYPVGEGPQFPLHWGCRTLRVPVVKAQYRVPGFDPKRASQDGPVSGQLTYDGFLRKQSAEFQDEVLGKGRAELFRGGMPVSKFTDDLGRAINLGRLKALDG